MLGTLIKTRVATFTRSLLEHRHPASPWDNLKPIREELFGPERLEEHARSLAAAQIVIPGRERGRPLARRLVDNGATLLGAYRSMAATIDDGRAITPAAGWLIDNYYLVERQIRAIRTDLPSGYYRQLPKLAAGPFRRYPRVFGMAWAFVAHTDSVFGTDMLLRYVRAYQEVQPLSIGELWAISITLRIVLIENLARLARQMVDNRAARQQADSLADRLLGAANRPPEPVNLTLGEYDTASLPDAFVVQLLHRLRDQDPRITPALAWIDERLTTQATTADAVVRDVHRRQGAANVTVRNIITSLRLISDVDWQRLFERTSLVDDVLAGGSDFVEMDFPTRNLYRTAIEELARGSKYSQLEIAERAVLAAKHDDELVAGQAEDRSRDPGYHLVAGGRRAFELSIGFHSPIGKWAARLNLIFGMGGYGTAIVLAALTSLALPLLALAALDVDSLHLVVLGLIGAVPAIDAAVALVNRAVTASFGATPLPALELRDGVPAHLRTLVAVPTLLTTPEAIDAQIERLEIHYLASPVGALHFALLSDWLDARTEHAEDDDALLSVAAAGIDRLNQRYGPAPGGVRFLLLHRRRVWNEAEARWIGWERKRGKLHELNRWLRGATDTTFIPIGGEPPLVLSDVRYVVTLDADTKLPRDTVRRLVGKMAHPLNRPRFDPAVGRVVEGYAVLQPRVTPSLPVGTEGSTLQRIFSNLSGIDPYGSAVSDVYQDLFGEGSYAGKGIYDVDAFEASLLGRVPDSMLLSHDLFEGIFARAGLASDVEVVEDYPARYDVGAARHHRWARGDWQLLPWIVGLGPRPGGSDGKVASISSIGRWKMLDNLRRTLSAPLAVVALLAGWTMPLGAAATWTAFIAVTLVLPTAIPVAAAVLRRRPSITFASNWRALGRDVRQAVAQSMLILVLLAHQGWLMGDAIARTLWRLIVTRRHLLEWMPAAQATSGSELDVAGFYRLMAGALVTAAVAIAVTGLAGGGAWLLAVPFAALWLVSPIIARRISLSPAAAAHLPMSDADARTLRMTARRTWRFFETFVTAADHMLPPDNFQEDPTPTVAHRTSPTNIGLYLLSVVSARDFGWIGTADAVDRLEATLTTIAELAHFRGHLYNWYDTRDLRPLEPRYVSSVDSGNLAGHLIALAGACKEWISVTLAREAALAGVADALDLAAEEAARLRDSHHTQTVTWPQFDDALARLRSSLHSASPDAAGASKRLADLFRAVATFADIAHALAMEHGDDSGADMLFWIEASKSAIEGHRRDVAAGADTATRLRLASLENRARSMALAMEFGFLLDDERKLLSIGYLVPEGTLDPNCYDLLASEARLASFVAIAKGDVPTRHWFRLGRAATPVAHSAALVSWSGSMFEYLMPSLVMRAPADSLLAHTNRLIVGRQIDYATRLRLPWGISESAYNARDLEFTYQYSNFGVPGLGLKRGLGENRVIAPYATALAAMVDPRAASANLVHLETEGGLGRYGFYEALDYTPARLPKGHRLAVVHAFMAHHQGMTVVAIADALLDGVMRTRFHAEPIVQASELLLQERIPRDVAITLPWAAEVKSGAGVRDIESSIARRFDTAHQSVIATQLLSNGRYTTMLTAAGSGYSRWRNLAVTRWREDATSDDLGFYVFLRDTAGGEAWSAGFQPTGVEPRDYSVAFNEDRVDFSRHDGPLITSMEVIVSAEDDAEVRRVSVSNLGDRGREIEITSYAELVLGPHADDVAHPAFSKMFIETEYLAESGTIVATRRRRTPTDPEIWAGHLAVVDGEAVGMQQIETDRARFLGRGHGTRNPIAAIDGRPLSNTVGAVLDPVFALRRRVRIAPGATARVAFWTMVSSTREALLNQIDKHRDSAAFGRALTFAWTQAQVQLYHLDITPGEAAVFQGLAGHLIYAGSSLRPASETIIKGSGAQPRLWALGISGDLPIIVLRIADPDNLDLVRNLLRAHEYWRMKQLAVDLVILNERQSSYAQDLQMSIETMVRTRKLGPSADGVGASGRVFTLRMDTMQADARALLLSVARVVLVAQRGSLFDQLDRIRQMGAGVGSSPRRRQQAPAPPAPLPTPELELFNGLGGFADGGKEYVTVLGPGQSTPAPWINVISNPNFGFQVATEGSGYTWSSNSRENQLTPWSNDPVTDRAGEAFYIRDEESGELWSPTALPVRDPKATYLARHGHGYSRFEHLGHGIAAELTQFVPVHGSIKISRLVLRNRSGRARHLGVTGYVEWVLGTSRSASLPFVSTEIDATTGAMFARNPWNATFGSRVAFFDMAGRQTDWTGDRREFIGRNGTLASPAALLDDRSFSKAVGAGLDPCGVIGRKFDLPANGSVELVFFLGQAAGAEEARELIAHYRAADLDSVRADVARHWDDVLGAVEVRTPDRPMDIMLNGWLLYQTLACRIWARSAFYQASGAYGFRDQLQDGMALAATQPALTREHLLRAAARQFVEGDVQHWWLPYSGQGVRTRISDDRAWLAYSVAQYVETTGDTAVLDETIPFLEGQMLHPGEADNFFLPTVADQAATLFEHAAKALDHSLALGSHGLPLIGTGDWNDGMNRVGDAGAGESVWLGWFLYAALQAFIPLARSRGEKVRATKWRAHATALKTSLDREGWDGEWYRRAFFDDGTPLGSASNVECRIDAIAQSWAVLSGAGTAERASLAMAAAERELIRPQARLALLFTPPFDKAPQDPGYIKGYPPGVRENGGQYTHAALWSVLAFAVLGQGDKATDLFALLNPINRSLTRADAQRYKVEPYVVAADIYSVPPHVGRGGWTWYTGSAGWMQRAGIEGILGLRLKGKFLQLDPCIPKAWPGFEMTLRHCTSRYEIKVDNSGGVGRGVREAQLDDAPVATRPLRIRLVDDGATHHISVRLG